MTIPDTISVIPPILRQHAEGAAFLWTQRGRMFHDPAFGETDLGRLDRRLAAHIDGMLASGPAAFAEAEARFDDFPEAGEMFAWAVTALASGSEPALSAALERAGASGPATWRGLSGAVAWAGPGAVSQYVKGWFSGHDRLLRLLAVTACSHHRVDPGDWLDRCLADDDPMVRARALRLLGEIGRTDRTGGAIEGLMAADEAERFAAARSALLLGRKDHARPVLCTLAEAGGKTAAAATELAVLCGGAELRRWLGGLMRRPDRTEAAVMAAGAIRDPDVREWLIDRSSDPDLSALVGRSLRAALDFDLDDTDVFATDPSVLGPDFTGRDDGPWPVAGRLRTAMAKHGGHGRFTSLIARRRECLSARIAAPGGRLEDWRQRRNYPAWS